MKSLKNTLNESFVNEDKNDLLSYVLEWDKKIMKSKNEDAIEDWEIFVDEMLYDAKEFKNLDKSELLEVKKFIDELKSEHKIK
jgi:hypothetical protein